MRTIQCAACGVTVTFHQKGPRKYCFDCIPAGDYSAETWKRVTGYTPVYNAKRRAEYVPKPRPRRPPYSPKACSVCGDEYTPTGGQQRYCSKACQTIALTRVCEVEGCERTGIRRMCEMHILRRRRGVPAEGNPKPEPKPKACVIPWATCEQCGAPYVRRHGRLHCLKRRVSKQGLEYIDGYVPLPDREATCRECCGTFSVRQGEWTPQRCPPCRKARMRDQKQDQKHRRRVRRSDATVEVVYRRKVYERDGWQCGICHRPLKRDAVVPHPLAATLDHIVPLAGGGEHSYANVQAAHFRCNSRKSDGAGQLRLAM